MDSILAMTNGVSYQTSVETYPTEIEHVIYSSFSCNIIDVCIVHKLLKKPNDPPTLCRFIFLPDCSTLSCKYYEINYRLILRPCDFLVSDLDQS